MEKLFFIPPSLLKQNIKQEDVDIDKCYIELNDRFIIYSTSFVSQSYIDPDDEMRGTKSEKTVIFFKVQRSEAKGVEKSYDAYNRRWNITVAFLAANIQLFFRKESDADLFFSSIDKYIFG